MKTEISTRLNELLVLLTEEYGYRLWFWFPKMSENELVQWWKALESVDPYFMTPEPLPGDVLQVTEETDELFYQLKNENKYYRAYIHCDDDSVLKSPRGKSIYHKGYEEE